MASKEISKGKKVVDAQIVVALPPSTGKYFVSFSLTLHSWINLVFFFLQFAKLEKLFQRSGLLELLLARAAVLDCCSRGMYPCTMTLMIEIESTLLGRVIPWLCARSSLPRNLLVLVAEDYIILSLFLVMQLNLKIPRALNQLLGIMTEKGWCMLFLL